MCTKRSPRPPPCRRGIPQVLQPHVSSAFALLGDFDGFEAIESQQVDFSSQRGCARLMGTVQCSSSFLRSKIGCSFTLMTTYRSPGARCSGRIALPAPASRCRAGIHSGWNGNFQLSFGAHLALAMALGARPANNLAAASTLPAGAADLQEALLVDHLAASVAHRAGNQTVVLFGARSLTAGAQVQPRHLMSTLNPRIECPDENSRS